MIRTAVVLVALLLTLEYAVAGKYNPVLKIGDKAPAWTDLEGVDGHKHSLSDLADKQVIVVVFTCNSCPVATDYEDRILGFSKKFAGQDGKVSLVAINVNTGDGQHVFSSAPYHHARCTHGQRSQTGFQKNQRAP